MLIFGSFTKKTIKSYDFICNSHKEVNKKEFIRTGRNKKAESASGFLHPPELCPVKTAATYSPACAVPSAWRSLTALFGMGRGGTSAPKPPQFHCGRERQTYKHDKIWKKRQTRKFRAISNARLWCLHLYTCVLSTS